MEAQIRLEHGMDNVLRVENSEQWNCRIQIASTDIGAFAYIWLHEIAHDKKYRMSFICFSHVRYFDGPLYWTGVNFKTASIEERNKFLEQTGLDELKEISPSQFYLFICNTLTSPVKILARSAFYEENTAEYHQIQDDNLVERVSILAHSQEPGILKVTQITTTGRKSYASSTVAQVLECFEQGYKHEEILVKMPWLEPEDIQACLVYARQAIEKK